LELGANFRPEDFDHVAFFDPDASWIEMRLRARAPQQVTIPGAGIEVSFEAGEEIRTEISAKFTRAGVGDELAGAGLGLEEFFTDPRESFGVALAGPQRG
ncbi:MAG: L-histidine N(alpha)-methyltransferase, partial [Thermoleophilaceae bacterium]|nr:L-histidine N(alpha)-methyltransferase [Thermoleophilaceae bacterium]